MTDDPRLQLSLILPLPGGYINGGFKAIYHTDRGSYQHPGSDLVHKDYFKTRGSDVVAAAGGIIKKIHRVGDGVFEDFGVCVIIDHDGTVYWTLYAHLIDEELPIFEGQRVAQGQKIGRVGDTGYTFGDHLHWALSKEPNPDFNPMRVVGADGVGRITNPDLLDPADFLAPPVVVVPAPPIPEVDETEEARAETRRLNEAVMLREAIRNIASDRDYSRVLQAAEALRKAGFQL